LHNDNPNKKSREKELKKSPRPRLLAKSIPLLVADRDSPQIFPALFLKKKTSNGN
jgi:hypothetical protein